MRKLSFFLALILLPVFAFAGGGSSFPLKHVKINLHDKASLQRGAKMYMNYCSGCHSLRYMRYNRMAKDLGLVGVDGKVDNALLKENLMFAEAKPGDLMTIAMDPKASANWFGITPPDLTLSARVRGADWLYTYLLSFYRDPSRPWGVNNWLFPDVAMPNVLGGLQGEQIPMYHTETLSFGGESKQVKVLDHLQLLEKGQMTPHQFDAAVTDTVNFLVYVAEPFKLERISLGMWVIGFLLLMWGLFYLLKKEFWKDIK